MLRRMGTPCARTRLPGVALALVLLLAGILLPLGAGATVGSTGVVGPKHYYLALGDSVAFGYQPNLDFSHGYTAQWFSGDLAAKGSQEYVNYACNGETSVTFVNGNCPYSWLLHDHYAGAQLSAAVAFIQAHPGQVSPVTLDIGANDMLDDINDATCTIDLNAWNQDLQALDQNLNVILQALTSALTDAGGNRTGDLILMNYYNPYQNDCTGSSVDSNAYTQQLNALIASHAAAYNLPVADVYTAFGSSAAASNPALCGDTWMCRRVHDIHPSGGRWGEPGNGYGVIAAAFKQTIGY